MPSCQHRSSTRRAAKHIAPPSHLKSSFERPRYIEQRFLTKTTSQHRITLWQLGGVVQRDRLEPCVCRHVIYSFRGRRFEPCSCRNIFGTTDSLNEFVFAGVSNQKLPSCRNFLTSREYRSLVCQERTNPWWNGYSPLSVAHCSVWDGC